LARSMSGGVEDLLLSASFRIDDNDDDDDDGDGGSGGGTGEEGKLITEEGRRTGNVAKAIYITYLKAAGGWSMIFMVFCVSAFSAATPIASQWWISEWTEDRFGWSQTKYLKVFGIFTGLCTLVFISRGLFVCLAAVRAAKKMHGGMVDSLLAAPLSFFHTTPQGRIMNRCSSDMETVDEQAAPMMGNFLNQILAIGGSIVAIIIATPWFSFFLPPVAWMYFTIGKYYVASSRELKRLSSIHKSPVYEHFTEALRGGATIRAFGDVDRYIEDHALRVDRYFRAFWPSMVINRWLSLRLDFIGAVLTAAVAAAIFLTIDFPFGLEMDPGKAGFAISQIISITAFLSFTVMIYGQLELTAIAIERIAEYTHLPVEAQRDAPFEPDAKWPQSGKIELKNYGMAYRKGLPLALRNVSLKIAPREKIGICGRTGAGKSSIFNAILRLSDVQRGQILIDGVEIHSVGLALYRSKISVVSQESIVFASSVRYNLDPAGAHSDMALWGALLKVQLEVTVKQMGGLEAKIAEDGGNLSVGERQLLSIARCILSGNKIILLDEATSSVDVETDRMIQQTIRNVFSDCTVLTIAHRLNTIADSSRIMVLDKGRVAEFEPPSDLLLKPNSIYKSLVDAAKGK